MEENTALGSYSFKNGTIVKAGGKSVVCVNYGSSLTKSVSYSLDFSGVTFRATSADTSVGVITHSWEDGFAKATARISVDATFTDCVFDFGGSTAGITMMPLSFSGKDRVVFNVTVSGGRIIASKADDLNRFITLDTNANGRADSVIYTALSGKYVTLELPEGESAPSAVYPSDNGELTFVKSSAEDGTVKYTLAKTVVPGIDYIPKLQLTVGNEIGFNIYLPKTYLKSFTVNGKTPDSFEEVSLEGVDYYLIKVSLPVYRAAEDITLDVTLTVLDTDYKGSLVFSIPSYTAIALEDCSSDAEAALLKDALAYIGAAYRYFGNTEASGVEDVLGSYVSECVPGATVPSVQGFSGAAFILSDKVAVRFYPAGDDLTAYSFFVNGTELSATAGLDTNGAYLEITLLINEACENIECKLGSESLGFYSLGDYYTFAKASESEPLMDLVKKLMILGKSAGACVSEQ